MIDKPGTRASCHSDEVDAETAKHLQDAELGREEPGAAAGS
jgi:hypothetical protein